LLLTLLHSFELVASGTAWAIPLPTTKILLSYEIWWLAPLCLVLVAWAAGIRKLRIADFLALIFLVTAAGAWIWISTLAPPLLAAALVTALLSIAAREKQPVTGRELISARWGERLTAAALLVASTTGVGALLLQPIQYQQGDSILMPALISATAEVDPMVRTLVINTEGENLSAELVWNDGRHLDETSQRIEVIAQLQGEQTRQRVARLVAGLVAGNSQVASPELDGLAIGYILVSDPSAELTRSLATIDGLASSGQTEYGDLWRNTRYETSGNSSASPSITQWVLLVLLSGLALLAIPKPRLGRRSAGANPIFDEVTD
jgi:hypothetical protein